MSAISLALDAFISQHKMYKMNCGNSSSHSEHWHCIKKDMDGYSSKVLYNQGPSKFAIFLWNRINDTTAKMGRNLRNETFKNIMRLHMIQSSI
jgi:hypothetical protein